MEKFEHPLLIVDFINWALGPLAQAFQTAIGRPLRPDHLGYLIPPYMAMIIVIVAGFTLLGLLVKSRVSVENPGKLQIIFEDVVGFLVGLLTEWLGPKGVRYLPLIGALFFFIFASNYAGFFPGLMSPTSNINVTLACAITTWVFYHLQGFIVQGPVNYLLHFAFPPGVPKWMFFLMLPIELISHTSRVMSLSLRLFGNIFGEELVVLVLASIVPYFAPVVVQPLFLITSGLQAFIFVLLTIIYLQGATHVDHAHDHGDPSHGSDEHGTPGHEHGDARDMAAMAAV
jgi:F-type H+-transporting ATPase subunit a